MHHNREGDDEASQHRHLHRGANGAGEGKKIQLGVAAGTGQDIEDAVPENEGGDHPGDECDNRDDGAATQLGQVPDHGHRLVGHLPGPFL